MRRRRLFNLASLVSGILLLPVIVQCIVASSQWEMARAIRQIDFADNFHLLIVRTDLMFCGDPNALTMHGTTGMASGNGRPPVWPKYTTFYVWGLAYCRIDEPDGSWYWECDISLGWPATIFSVLPLAWILANVRLRDPRRGFDLTPADLPATNLTKGHE